MLNLKNNIKLVVTTAFVGLFVAACAVSPVALSPSVSTSGVVADALKGRTVYVKVSDSRASKNLGTVTTDDGTTTLEASKAVGTVIQDTVENTLREYGMTIVNNIADADNHMFITIRDLGYVYPKVKLAVKSAESSMALRISLAGERATHRNVISAWSRYEDGDPNGADVRGGLNDVASRALHNALTEKKMISVLAGNE